jgi:hypothetical protein
MHLSFNPKEQCWNEFLSYDMSKNSNFVTSYFYLLFNSKNMNSKINPVLVLFALLLTFSVRSKLYFQQSASRGGKVNVVDESKNQYANPWAGGMNSCQFGEIDLNLDGIKDLFVFDRNGDRILTFINGGTAGTIDYTYAPEYRDKFPELSQWVKLVDYNMDGKEDIFAYSPGFAGIQVYKNVSTTTLEFELEVYPYITSYQGGGDVNILTTYADYPGITDIDNDGDIDIITFWGLGSFVEYHQNRSMEKYGIPDSLDFIQVSDCWGHFAENEESNKLYLDTCVGGGYNRLSLIPDETKDRHTGSTFLFLDSDDNNIKDLLLGDVDYPNLIQLINGGTLEEAYITSYDTLFPSYDHTVHLFSMPVAAYIDVDNDDVKELIVSPFDPSPVTSENFTSIWLYDNSGSNNSPVFELVKDNFLQEGMIDLGAGAYPVFYDYDSDGLTDLLISNFGYYIYSYYKPGMLLQSVYRSDIALLRNTGTADNPAFEFVTRDYAGLSKENLNGIYPAFGDIDGDGDADMIIGYEEGSLWFYENIAGQGAVPQYAGPVKDYQNIDVGFFSTPQLFDLNEDGLPDLIIGERKGNLNYYENTGTTTNPVFTFVTDSLGKVNVTDNSVSYYGYSTPCFFKDQQGDTKLIVGSEQGKVFYFENIEGNLEGAFTESDNLHTLINDEPFEIEKGIRSAAAITDLNNDGWLDLITGNYSGGLNYYEGVEKPGVFGVEERVPDAGNVRIYPNPASNRIHIKISSSGDDSFNYSVFTITGTIVKKGNIDGRESIIDISVLKPGIYFLGIGATGNTGCIIYKKIVVTSGF